MSDAPRPAPTAIDGKDVVVVSLTDEPPLAQATVIISAVPRMVE